MESVLSTIKQYIDNCQNCELYQQGTCGFIFRERNDYPGTMYYEVYCEMEYNERVMFDTQHSHSPCESQHTEISFLNKIDDMLEKADCHFDSNGLTRILNKCHRLQQKVAAYDGKLIEALGNGVSKAILRCLAYIDYESLMHGENIIRCFQKAGMNYSRKEGLFTLCPESIAIPLLEKAKIVDIDRIISTSVVLHYNPELEDVDFPTEQENEHIVILEQAISELELPTQLEYQFPKEIMNDNHQLVCSMSKFVRYCVDHKYYHPYTIKAWEQIDGLIISSKNKPITAKQLAQSYQDLMSKRTLK